MKNILIILSILILSSCNDEYKYIGQEIIDGKVSATTGGHSGKIVTYPKIWVQNATQTKKVEIPFEYENKWKVGDSCLLIIEKYEKIK